jgi:hypothetical protein
MIETLESRRLLSALPVDHDPVDAEPRTVRIVTLEEFLGMESWDDDEIVVEWYSKPGSGEGDAEDDGDWQIEVEEDMSDVCDGGPMEEALNDEDFALVEEWNVLEQPIVVSVNDDDGGGSSFNDDVTIGDDDDEDDVLGSEDDNDDDEIDLLA